MFLVLVGGSDGDQKSVSAALLVITQGLIPVKRLIRPVRLVDLVTVVEVRALRQTVPAADILQRQIDGPSAAAQPGNSLNEHKQLDCNRTGGNNFRAYRKDYCQ